MTRRSRSSGAPFAVVLLGPDGAGKTTVATRLAAQTSVRFPRRTVVRWTLGALPPFEEVVAPVIAWYERRDPRPPSDGTRHSAMLRPLPAWQSFLIVGYHALDLLLGRFKKHEMDASCLLIFDRSFLDFHYVLGHSNLPSVFLWAFALVVPEPDVILYLERDATAIYRDKPELTLAELGRQQAVIARLVASHPRAQNIAADAGIDAAVAQAESLIAAAAIAADAASRRRSAVVPAEPTGEAS